MPTLNDAFNELQSINSHLQTLHADNSSIIAGQAAIAAAIAASTAAINDVRNSVDVGTSVLKSIAHLQQVTNATLLHMSHQQDAMICALEAISRNTCALHNEAHIQTGRQTVIAAAETALLSNIEVMLAPLWVWLFLNETASAATFTGGAILLVAVTLNGISGARRAATA